MRSRFLVLSIVVLFIFPTFAVGQIVIRGSRGEKVTYAGPSRSEIDTADHLSACTANGKAFFGVGVRWTNDRHSIYAGPLYKRRSGQFKVGDYGCYPFSFQIIQVVGPKSVLIRPNNSTIPMFLKGLDTSNVVDGADFSFDIRCSSAEHSPTQRSWEQQRLYLWPNVGLRNSRRSSKR